MRVQFDKQESITVAACNDCMLMIANGDEPEELSDLDRIRWRRDFNRGIAGFWATLGHLPEYAHPGRDCDKDGECARDDFGWWPCAICNSNLGGERHDVTLWPIKEVHNA